MEHAWNEELAVLGVTHAGVMALDVLHSKGSMTQAQLAEEARVQAQTMGKTLHRLEAHGHISRAKNECDHRSHVVSISPVAGVLERAAAHRAGPVGGGQDSDEEFRCRLVEIIYPRRCVLRRRLGGPARRARREELRGLQNRLTVARRLLIRPARPSAAHVTRRAWRPSTAGARIPALRNRHGVPCALRHGRKPYR
ncbi:MarR family transcriptional regulator [Kocuria rhizophila]|nr:MarR family transcriptional regulator [Kocuria rhizophila]